MKFMVVDIPAQTSGGLSVLKSFYNHVLFNEKEHEWIFVLSTPSLDNAEHVTCLRYPNSVKNKFNRIVFEEIKLNKIICDYKPDAILSLQNIAFNNRVIPQLVYLHNCIAFQEDYKFSFFNRKDRVLAFQQFIVGRKIKNSIKKADYVIVQSEWFKKKVLEEVRNSTKVVCVNNGHEFIDLSQEKIKIEPGRKVKLNSFIYPASNYSYKNHKVIIDAVIRLRELGFTNFKVNLTISEDELSKVEGFTEAIKENFVALGYIKQESLIDHYKNSVLIYPSFFESMGLPLYESKNLGGCIIAADSHYAHEALGDYPNTDFFTPNAGDELSKLMISYLSGNRIYRSYDLNELSAKESRGWRDVINLLKKISVKEN